MVRHFWLDKYRIDSCLYRRFGMELDRLVLYLVLKCTFQQVLLDKRDRIRF